MRPALLLTGTALAAAVIGLGAGPVHAENDTPQQKLEVHPATARPGETITVNTTACGTDSSGTGDANSVGAGDFELRPATHKEAVAGQFTLPPDAPEGTHDIAVACDNGNTAQGTLTVTPGPPEPTHDDPAHHDPTRHEPAEHDPARHEPGHRPTHPTGHVKTGVGGAAGSNTTQIAAGVAVLAATAVGGTWLLRRRASGTRER
ncbi:hypothetical protein AR457_23510 [Streptomyces agglomeratus]|uniref:Sortase n=1 Tax=Streptomyces agglomeratus TaxID=285458 RepID=A0A1E5PBX3_9ACTN|nr:hypothetical protein [Streptomyces agglomeratus]OEJ26987.1 hypothetical protein AS594_23395 [Streptomyces agglomeratus]OEJ38962.1 hypothetical protein BGK70_13145 [Streptomyces agglomeratus]OEJ46655.1 hypothetical protein AR457_23510 [Streptomyces agglomeratus]OEJ51492.1 hypothetical protein BGK72_12615 [Streptomyces agglomeratus]